jgi:hypothetical protein
MEEVTGAVNVAPQVEGQPRSYVGKTAMPMAAGPDAGLATPTSALPDAPGASPSQLMAWAARTDAQSRASFIGSLQRSMGNVAVGSLLRDVEGVRRGRQPSSVSPRTAASSMTTSLISGLPQSHRAAGHCFPAGRIAGVLARQHDGGDVAPVDAGVPPLPAGVPLTPEQAEAARLRAIPPAALEDRDLGPAIDLAQNDADPQRVDALIAQIRQRDSDEGGFGVGLPMALPRGQGGSALVTSEVALAMIENMVGGRPPFRPELGVGGVSWFVTEGTPYTGVGSGNVVPVQVELMDSSGGRTYQQADLDAIFVEEEARARPEVDHQVRERFRIRTGRPAPEALTGTLRDKVAYQLRRLAERRMWERIGREVAASPARVGEVVLAQGGRFSRLPGRFKLVADAARIRLRGGLPPLIEALRPTATPVPALEAEAEALTRRMRIAGKVRTVLRVAGKIVIVIAMAADVYRIIIANDVLEAIITTASGWAGASIAAAAFAAWWAPADATGPWAWVAHGVGTLASGAIGYWVGSESTRYVYRLIVQSEGEVQSQ